MILYSIIIPHYNSANLLHRCLNSIPEREDTEIIVVDDCSDPSIVDFDNFPGTGRKNFHLVRCEQNGGGGKARNEGMKMASGKWFLFADCDDYFTPYLNTFLDKYSNCNDYDIIYLNSQIVHENPSDSDRLPFSRYIANYIRNKFYSEKVLRYGMYTPWSRMVKAELVKTHGLQFEALRTGNDAMFCLNCSKYAKRISVEENIIYNYFRPSEGSFCSQQRIKYDNMVARVELGLRMNELFDSVGYTFKDSLLLGCLLTKDKAYTKMLLSIIKEKNIPIFLDLIRLFKICIGMFFKII